jgi:hypothetical protein
MHSCYFSTALPQWQCKTMFSNLNVTVIPFQNCMLLHSKIFQVALHILCGKNLFTSADAGPKKTWKLSLWPYTVDTLRWRWYVQRWWWHQQELHIDKSQMFKSQNYFKARVETMQNAKQTRVFDTRLIGAIAWFISSFPEPEKLKLEGVWLPVGWR